MKRSPIVLEGWKGPEGPPGGFGITGDSRAYMGDIGATSDSVLATTNAGTAVYTSASSILNK